MLKQEYLDAWLRKKISDPITKESLDISSCKLKEGFIDLRIFLKNTYGFKSWIEGQKFFEEWESNGTGYKAGKRAYLDEIEADTEIYQKYQLSGKVLDVGGLSGSLRHFLGTDVKYVCIDPFEKAPYAFPIEKSEAYPCLKNPFNFLIANAEFLPFKKNTFDFVHMRSMLDHVQVPDLAILEAHRVLKSNGNLLIGMTVEGGKSGKLNFKDFAKELIRSTLAQLGLKHFKDHHTWHPTYKGLISLAEDNGFIAKSELWQAKWGGKVVYIMFEKECSLDEE